MAAIPPQPRSARPEPLDAVPRIILSLVGLALVGVMFHRRGWDLTGSLAYIEVAGIAIVFCVWSIWSAVRDLRGKD